jgi:hypothetical protein
VSKKKDSKIMDFDSLSDEDKKSFRSLGAPEDAFEAKGDEQLAYLVNDPVGPTDCQCTNILCARAHSPQKRFEALEEFKNALTSQIESELRTRKSNKLKAEDDVIILHQELGMLTAREKSILEAAPAQREESKRPNEAPSGKDKASNDKKREPEKKQVTFIPKFGKKS